MEVNDSLIDAFQSLFRGREDVWGSVEGRANKEPVTRDHYAKHLSGDRSLGIYPLLPDGYCYFAAVDLDEKDWEKAKAIRNEIVSLFIPAYIAQSKGKGYHIYMFADPAEPFVAKDIRYVLNGVLKKLGFKCEVFPKQDKLDDTRSFGNYINLPMHGFTRYFQSLEHKQVPHDEAIEHFRTIDRATVENACRMVPDPGAAPTPKPGKGTAARKPSRSSKKHPPCIVKIMQGVATPGRDVAAFALARYFLDMGEDMLDVVATLEKWDESNLPPINDPKIIKTKVESAVKGYAFGCKSIEDEPHLSTFCVGADQCEWLAKIENERKKKGLIIEQSYYENDTHLYEEAYKDGQAFFYVLDKTSGNITTQDSIMTEDNKEIRPCTGPELTEGAVLFPSALEDYGDTSALVSEVRAHIHKYLDVSEEKGDFFLEFATWYVMMTWVYDKLNTVSYLRFLGDTGCGKSRALDVVGRICYKPMIVSGSVTPAPIYRIIRRFRGTIVLDEADFQDSSEKSEVTTILNCGFERGRPVVRCSKDDPNVLEILPTYCPKVFASRFDFNDAALEARCLTHKMSETDREDIPFILEETFYNSTQQLRNKLLKWRFDNRDLIDGKVAGIDLGKIEPRLQQTGLPFATVFRNMPDVLARFKTFMIKYNESIIALRSEKLEGRIILAMLICATEGDPNFVSSSMIVNKLSEEFKIEVSGQKVGKIIKALGLETTPRRQPGKRQQRYIEWKAQKIAKLMRRYMPKGQSQEEFQYLLEVPTLMELPEHAESAEPSEPSEPAQATDGIDWKDTGNF